MCYTGMLVFTWIDMRISIYPCDSEEQRCCKFWCCKWQKSKLGCLDWREIYGLKHLLSLGVVQKFKPYSHVEFESSGLLPLCGALSWLSLWNKNDLCNTKLPILAFPEPIESEASSLSESDCLLLWILYTLTGILYLLETFAMPKCGVMAWIVSSLRFSCWSPRFPCICI